MFRSILAASLLSAFCLGFAAPAYAKAPYKIFAIDLKGAVGHGMSPNYSMARNFALSYCGQSGCKVVDVTHARCHAIAHSFHGGYWYGTGAANSMGMAMGYALNYCAENAPASSCKIAYKFCS